MLLVLVCRDQQAEPHTRRISLHMLLLEIKAGDPRTEKMPVDQDWTAVYPSATPFRPNAVPLPLRMGYPVKGGVPPEKKGNLELLKIPNFLHLTPVAIKKHCEALKPFCTEWPSALDTDATCDEHFPIKVDGTDYVSAGPSVRNPSARVVHLRVKLSSLNLDDHASKKMLKLVGNKYCKDTDVITIKTDSCPLRQQNQDYAMYLLTVLYHESWKTEAWEAEKSVADMEEYSWEDSPSQRNLLDVLVRRKAAGEGEGEGEEVREQLLGRSEVQEYKDSVTRLKNEGESESAVLQYKEAVKKVLNL
ncbi:28S ribosomal protein S35, mitochondrial [Liparis tanakae]|uniref:28S ribosomal protein S35, mitochondrial n=1 Tax=Liparis tanakae TaxID=230148 RepID=A0A4Z2G9X6_9TELE|nr:28S ribosomal protein S35, mitochondrial [Liparis tanakae]